MKKKAEGGYLLILALVFGGIFFVILSAFSGFIVTDRRASVEKSKGEQALQVAEAGLDYYRWYLAHFPNDLTNGMASSGPYVHQYEDPESGEIGEFSLEIDGNLACGDVVSVDITSTGKMDDSPTRERSVYGRYARPTVAEYAYIINSNVWAGADRTIIGPYHSNGGVRMDGTNNSTVSSGVNTWLCTSSFGCSPSSNRAGVFGAGPNDELWTYPTPPIDFTGLTVDLAAMKTKAQASGRYIGPSNDDGYRIVFRNNHTFDLYRVTSVTTVWGYTTEDEWQQEQTVIQNQTFLANYPVPSSCSVIFVEDKIWLEGTVSDKVTIAAANVVNPGINPNIVLINNITYTAYDGTVGLLAIAEDSVLVGLNVPNVMTLNGIFIAQTGRFGRNHYCQDDCSSESGSQGLPTSLDSYVTRSSLTVNGTIVSNGREGTKWTSGNTFVSGFNTRTNTYDRDLVISPPPLTPNTSDSYKFIEWREVE